MAREQPAASPVFASLPLLLEHYGRITPDEAALLTPEGATIRYGALLDWVQQSTDGLRRFGIGRTDRVAVIAPIGLDSALVTIAAAAAAICVPLNPALKADEWRRYFAELDLAAVLTCMAPDHPGQATAAALGLPVIQLVDGTLKLLTARPRRLARTRPAVGADDAFVLLTSGTTSRPKLVPLTHASVCRSGANAAASLGLGAQDRLLHMLPLYHAHGLFSGLLAALAVGSSVVCTGGFDADRLFGWLAGFAPTWYTAVPTIHRLVLAAASRHPQEAASCSLRLIRSASSSLPADLLHGLETTFGVPVIETYGMTEAASQIAANPLTARKPDSVGISAGAEIGIRNAAGQWLPPGEQGEIVLRGPTLTLQYANDPAATAAAFRDGWFHTGDLGRLDADGYLFILGRLRDIIDRGGQKIAPAEIERVLLQSESVAEVAAFPIAHRRLGEAVAAAIVLHPGMTADARSLRTLARRHLAEYKVPTRIAFVAEIPKTPAGKVNRSGLAAALGLSHARTGTVQPPRSELEAGLAALWSEILQLDRIGVDQDVFALGAESLAAMQMLSRLRLQFGVDLTLEDLLNAPTIAELANRVRSIPSLLPHAARTRSNRGKARATPLSFQQRRMQVLTRLDPIGSVYHVLDVVRLSGPLDVDALQLSLDQLLARHDILRSRFLDRSDEPVQAPGPSRLALERVEAAPLPYPASTGVIRRHALNLVHRSFALETGPPLRARLMRLGNEDHVLMVALHHIVTDGWSQSLFWHELQALYAAARTGAPAAVGPARLQYRDYVEWQRGWLKTEAAEAQRVYWRQQLDGLTELPLPTDRRPPPERSGRGARYPLCFPGPVTRRLKTFSRQHRVTLFMTILAAFQSVLHRHAGQDDIAVGSLLANRNRVEFEALFGMLVNTVILRTDFAGDPTVRDLLHRVRDVTLAAHRHGDLPIEIVHQVIRPAPGTERHAPFRSMLILQKAERRPASFPGLTLQRIDIDPGTAHQDLVLELREDDERLDGWLEYSTDLFDRATIARLAGHLSTALDAMVAHPDQRVSQLTLSPSPERRLLERWSQGPSEPADSGLGFVQRFLGHAQATPGAIAVSSGAERWSYGRLAGRSRAIAGRLAAARVGPETIVVLLAERTPDLLAAMIAVQWLGAAFLLLDPMHPPVRLADMIGRSAASVVVSTAVLARAMRRPGGQWLDLAAEDGCDPGIPVRPAPSSLAYVVYTSGSTGAPKGAMIEQRGLLNHLLSKVRDLPLTADDVVAQTAPQSFDIAVWQFLAPLLAGARVHICGPALLQEPAALHGEIEREAVTVLQLVPALLAGLLDLGAGGLGRLRVLLVTGEAVPPDLLRSWFQQFPGIPVINAYGPAECADDVATHRMTAAPDPLRPVPIGRPIGNTCLSILDANHNPTPAGIPGELHVGGAGVGRGYLHDPAQTAERFYPDPSAAQPGARRYRTGDLARWRTDGTLEYLGRIDDQIKLRGHRIEPGEIERALLDHPDIAAAAVLLRQQGGHEAQLAAFFVAAPLRQPSVEALREALKRRLPGIMVPAVFVRLDHMPLTPNGKVDRRALRTTAVQQDRDTQDTPPRTPTEHVVAAIWGELFGQVRIGARSDFFDLGGHSLLAGKVLARLARDCGRAPSLRAFFAAPTVEGLARATDALGPADPYPPEAEAHSESGPGLPSIAQEDVLRSEWAFPGLPQFNLPFAVRLRGKLDAAALAQSIAALISRHESLRTGFERVEGGSRALVAAPGTLGAPFTTLDLAAGTGPVTSEIKRLLLEKARLLADQAGWTVFDLARAPLLRFQLLRVEVDDHVLVMVLHHIIVDGWSIGILFEELSKLYAALAAGQNPSLPGPGPPFSSFARWQRASSATPLADGQLAFWRNRLRGAKPPFRTGGANGAVLAAAVEHAPIDLPVKLTKALTVLGHGEGVTLFTTLLAAFKVLLMARSARADLCVATAMANRSGLWTERIVGAVENTTVIRSRIERRLGFRAVLRRVGHAVTEAFERQLLPFETLANPRAYEASLAQAVFIMRDAAPQPLCFPGVTVAPFGDVHRQGQPVLPVDRTWISLSLKPVGSGVIGSCSAKPGLLGADAARRWAADYTTLLHRLVIDPEASVHELIEL